ncbi:MAG: hypothetical protein JST05_09525 [Acidobacteria bacterium]|nr:hypothetical protein [Acidobacteriota bacterium]
MVPSASSPSGEPARKPLERPLRSAKLKVGQSRGKKKINGAAGDLAAALFQREGRLMSAAEVDAALRREGWPGFSHLEDQSIKMSVQTMYRALQSRKKQFAFFGNGLWGLKEWQKGGVPNAKGDAMT